MMNRLRNSSSIHKKQKYCNRENLRSKFHKRTISFASNNDNKNADKFEPSTSGNISILSCKGKDASKHCMIGEVMEMVNSEKFSNDEIINLISNSKKSCSVNKKLFLAQFNAFKELKLYIESLTIENQEKWNALIYSRNYVLPRCKGWCLIFSTQRTPELCLNVDLPFIKNESAGIKKVININKKNLNVNATDVKTSLQQKVSKKICSRCKQHKLNRADYFKCIKKIKLKYEEKIRKLLVQTRIKSKRKKFINLSENFVSYSELVNKYHTVYSEVKSGLKELTGLSNMLRKRKREVIFLKNNDMQDLNNLTSLLPNKDSLHTIISPFLKNEESTCTKCTLNCVYGDMQDASRSELKHLANNVDLSHREMGSENNHSEYSCFPILKKSNSELLVSPNDETHLLSDTTSKRTLNSDSQNAKRSKIAAMDKQKQKDNQSQTQFDWKTTEIEYCETIKETELGSSTTGKKKYKENPCTFNDEVSVLREKLSFSMKKNASLNGRISVVSNSKVSSSDAEVFTCINELVLTPSQSSYLVSKEASFKTDAYSFNDSNLKNQLVTDTRSSVCRKISSQMDSSPSLPLKFSEKQEFSFRDKKRKSCLDSVQSILRIDQISSLDNRKKSYNEKFKSNYSSPKNNSDYRKSENKDSPLAVGKTKNPKHIKDVNYVRSLSSKPNCYNHRQSKPSMDRNNTDLRISNYKPKQCLETKKDTWDTIWSPLKSQLKMVFSFVLRRLGLSKCKEFERSLSICEDLFIKMDEFLCENESKLNLYKREVIALQTDLYTLENVLKNELDKKDNLLKPGSDFQVTQKDMKSQTSTAIVTNTYNILCEKNHISLTAEDLRQKGFEKLFKNNKYCSNDDIFILMNKGLGAVNIESQVSKSSSSVNYINLDTQGIEIMYPPKVKNPKPIYQFTVANELLLHNKIVNMHEPNIKVTSSEVLPAGNVAIIDREHIHPWAVLIEKERLEQKLMNHQLVVSSITESVSSIRECLGLHGDFDLLVNPVLTEEISKLKSINNDLKQQKSTLKAQEELLNSQEKEMSQIKVKLSSESFQNLFVECDLSAANEKKLQLPVSQANSFISNKVEIQREKLIKTEKEKMNLIFQLSGFHSYVNIVNQVNLIIVQCLGLNNSINKVDACDIQRKISHLKINAKNLSQQVGKDITFSAKEISLQDEKSPEICLKNRMSNIREKMSLQKNCQRPWLPSAGKDAIQCKTELNHDAEKLLEFIENVQELVGQVTSFQFFVSSVNESRLAIRQCLGFKINSSFHDDPFYNEEMAVIKRNFIEIEQLKNSGRILEEKLSCLQHEMFTIKANLLSETNYKIEVENNMALLKKELENVTLGKDLETKGKKLLKNKLDDLKKEILENVKTRNNLIEQLNRHKLVVSSITKSNSRIRECLGLESIVDLFDNPFLEEEIVLIQKKSMELEEQKLLVKSLEKELKSQKLEISSQKSNLLLETKLKNSTEKKLICVEKSYENLLLKEELIVKENNILTKKVKDQKKIIFENIRNIKNLTEQLSQQQLAITRMKHAYSGIRDWLALPGDDNLFQDNKDNTQIGLEEISKLKSLFNELNENKILVASYKETFDIKQEEAYLLNEKLTAEQNQKQLLEKEITVYKETLDKQENKNKLRILELKQSLEKDQLVFSCFIKANCMIRECLGLQGYVNLFENASLSEEIKEIKHLKEWYDKNLKEVLTKKFQISKLITNIRVYKKKSTNIRIKQAKRVKSRVFKLKRSLSLLKKDIRVLKKSQNCCENREIGEDQTYIANENLKVTTIALQEATRRTEEYCKSLTEEQNINKNLYIVIEKLESKVAMSTELLKQEYDEASRQYELQLAMYLATADRYKDQMKRIEDVLKM